MSSLMIRCPNTGRAVSTEIEIEPGVFRQLPNIGARMHCPVCGQDHAWQTGEAWLAGEPRQVETPRPAGMRAA
jgi:hypothetical protein